MSENGDRLMAMDDEGFRHAVIAESRGEADWVYDVVTAELDVCERWVEALQALVAESAEHVRERRAALESATGDERRELHSKRSRASYFNTKMIERLREAKAVRAELRRQENSRPANRGVGFLALVRVLRAVNEHDPTIWMMLDLAEGDREVLERELDRVVTEALEEANGVG